MLDSYTVLWLLLLAILIYEGIGECYGARVLMSVFGIFILIIFLCISA